MPRGLMRDDFSKGNYHTADQYRWDQQKYLEPKSEDCAQ
jgi:hypothetical protein